jgi:hypothetical protein
MIASQLRQHLPEIPPEKILDLLALKQRIGMSLPDVRFPATAAEPDDSIWDTPVRSTGGGSSDSAEVEKLISHLAEQVIAFLEKC